LALNSSFVKVNILLFSFDQSNLKITLYSNTNLIQY